MLAGAANPTKGHTPFTLPIGMVRDGCAPAATNATSAKRSLPVLACILYTTVLKLLQLYKFRITPSFAHISKSGSPWPPTN